MSSSGWHNRRAVSKKLDIRVFTGSRPRTFPGADKSTRLTHAKQVAFDTQIAAEARAAVKDLSSAGKRKLAHITGGIDDLQGQPPPPFDADDWDDEPADGDIELSAEGDEAEHLRRYAGRRYRQQESWSTRITRMDVKWTEQLPSLIDAFLEYERAPFDAAKEATEPPFVLPFVDVYNYSEVRSLYHIPGCTSIQIELIRQGCLSPTPTTVYTAISLRTLELYRRIRARQPRLSMQAWVRIICDMHNVTYRKTLWQQFNDAFDLYLRIRDGVHARINQELGRTTENWRITHSCPACHYQLVDDPPLDVALMGALDGNSSLKRVRLREGLEADPRRFKSDYYISEPEVDQFKYDVKARPSASTEASKSPEEGLAADGDDSVCARRWKAAMSDSHKKMWAIYRETGIFLAACRHAFVWWLCDMVESGELAKYPLAIIARVLSILGSRVGLGYDIGCSFTATISKSSISQDAINKCLRMVVNAFHGYAHNRLCQLRFHPLYVTGFGIEDLETCERIFSAFNGLAVITRYASQYHRHQAIDLFAKQWDEDKYHELSAFILNNYKQVQQILDEVPIAIEALQSGKSSEHTDYARHLDAERKYLMERSASVDESWTTHYVELLIKLDSALKVFDRASLEWSNTRSGDDAPRNRAYLNKLHAFDLLMQLTDMVKTFEEKHSAEIDKRWTPDDEQWKRACEALAVRKFRKALDKLEGLVVQRLFELAKMGLSGMGYKMRTHINKSLKTRCRAIQTALRQYNEAAQGVDRPELDWTDVSTYGSLAEFELLRESRFDIRTLPWAQSVNRQAANLYLKVERAKEERDRLNVEARRLATWMRDEEADLRACIARLDISSPALAEQVRQMERRRLRVNNIHRARLTQLYALPCFTGTRDLGHAVEQRNSSSCDESDMTDAAINSLATLEEDDGPDAQEDDAIGEELHALHTFMENLSLVEDSDSSVT